jgi:DNA-binding transcriptional MerR regulator
MEKVGRYSPGETASMSGVSADVQREWRRRELMPFEKAKSGAQQWASFDLKEVAALTIMRLLSECGTPLATARKTAMAGATHVVMFIAERLGGAAAKALRKQFPFKRGKAPERFAATGADVIPRLTDSIDDVFHDLVSPAVISLDLDAVARLIIDRATKPIVGEP